jgi:iron complex transport system ATP-binding protein
MISIDRLYFSFKNKENILKNISFCLKPGDFLALIGPNGAGKTTLLKLILGFLKPSSGQITIHQKQISDYHSRELAQKITLVSPIPSSNFNYKVFDIIKMSRFPYLKNHGLLNSTDKEIIDQSMYQMKIAHLGHSYFNYLSSGERQRVMLAKALAQQTDFLLLDEPLEHLDIGHKELFINHLLEIQKKFHLGILMTTHDLNIIKHIAQRILVLQDGSLIAAGQPQEILKPALLKKYFSLTT